MKSEGIQKPEDDRWCVGAKDRWQGNLPSKGKTVFALPATFSLLLVFLAVSAACQQGAMVHGQVINAKTNAPLAGAKVIVRFERLDERYNWVDAGHNEAGSDGAGAFSFTNPNMKARFVVFAQREGFYPNYDCRPVRRLITHPLAMEYVVEIRLAPVVSPQSLPCGEGEVRYALPGQRTGWNFAARAATSDAASDFVGEPDESDSRIVFLVARGKGGFVRAPALSGEWALFNMPLAPQENYQPRVDLREVPDGERTVYFVRTSDGAHYAKIDLGAAFKSREFIGIRFYWVYQPDGSHALEIPLEQKAK